MEIARAPLPKSVNVVGDRIGLDYGIDRKSRTRKYIQDSKNETRLEFDQLKNTYYSLSEQKTKKSADANKQDKIRSLLKAKNPLKLNAKIRKSLYKISTDEAKKMQYSTFEKIHQLWQEYIQKVLSDDREPLAIFKADLHGCLLTCTASKNPNLIGSKGIVVQETKNTFIIIKPTNRLLTLPKRESIFEFNVVVNSSGGFTNVYRIHGCNLMFTTQARTKTKYKQKRFQSDV